MTAKTYIKIEDLRENFAGSISTSNAGRDELVILYNKTFNSDVVTPYTGGKLREHQKDMISRILRRCSTAQNTLTGHAIGAGKTNAPAATA
jgi:N12 class adenine-specific DNA methylase